MLVLGLTLFKSYRERHEHWVFGGEGLVNLIVKDGEFILYFQLNEILI